MISPVSAGVAAAETEVRTTQTPPPNRLTLVGPQVARQPHHDLAGRARDGRLLASDFSDAPRATTTAPPSSSSQVVRGRDVAGRRRAGSPRSRRRGSCAASSSSCVPLCDEAAAVHDQDDVGPLRRRQPLGDDEGGAAGHQGLELRADRRLGRRVDRRGGVVHHEDARVDEQRAGDRDALALPARELHAALADTRRRSRRAALG